MSTVKLEIALEKESISYINNVFSQYEEVNNLPDVMERCVIHMYPKSDTWQGNELIGFNDALFCELHIYDIFNKTVFKTSANKDEVRVEVPCQIRIFKDLSTILIIKIPVTFANFQSFEVLGAD